MRLGRWTIGLGALLMAGLALYVLAMGDAERPSKFSPSQTSQWGAGSEERDRPSAKPRSQPVPYSAPDAPALDEIDAESRAAMRDLLRQAEGEADGQAKGSRANR